MPAVPRFCRIWIREFSIDPGDRFVQWLLQLLYDFTVTHTSGAQRPIAADLAEITRSDPGRG
jgi:hypothetical protein